MKTWKRLQAQSVANSQNLAAASGRNATGMTLVLIRMHTFDMDADKFMSATAAGKNAMLREKRGAPGTGACHSRKESEMPCKNIPPKHTPGPLVVEREQAYPFNVVTKNAESEVVWVERTCAHSSKMRNLDDLLSARGFGEDLREAAVAANERQWADAVLRAAAPELLEALQLLLEREGDRVFSPIGTECDSEELEQAKAKARAAIAKATGA